MKYLYHMNFKFKVLIPRTDIEYKEYDTPEDVNPEYDDITILGEFSDGAKYYSDFVPINENDKDYHYIYDLSRGDFLDGRIKLLKDSNISKKYDRYLNELKKYSKLTVTPTGKRWIFIYDIESTDVFIDKACVGLKKFYTPVVFSPKNINKMLHKYVKDPETRNLLLNRYKNIPDNRIIELDF